MARKIDSKRVMEELSFDETRINDAIIKQASLFYYYAMKWVEANNELNAVKLDLEMLEAELYDEYRKKLEGNGGKVTEGMIESAVKRDIRYEDLSKRYLALKKEVEEWNVVKEAFKQRKDMIEAMVNILMSVRSGEKPIGVEAEVIRKKVKDRIARRKGGGFVVNDD